MANKEYFNNALELLKTFVNIPDGREYDGIIVKSLGSSNTLDDNRRSNQTHIAITGEQMSMFPYLQSEEYFNCEYQDKNDDFKKYIFLKLPFYIYKDNVEKIGENSLFTGETSGVIKTFCSIVRSRRDGATDQLQLSLIAQDSKEFVDFRKMLHAGDYLVICKIKEKVAYDCFGVKERDSINSNGNDIKDLNNKFFYMTTISPVEDDALVIEEGTNYSFNRILFGAPGTGKSFKLNQDKDDLLKDGGSYERVTFHPDYAYANFVGTYKPIMVDCSTNKISDDCKAVVSVLADSTKTAQEKYDLLYDRFKEEASLTRLPLLLGLYTDGNFETKKKGGDDASNNNGVERNHGKAIRPYVALFSENMTKEEIAYKYVPGPFMRVFTKAMLDKEHNHLLIIEEINRANVAAVFGDLFQLLDRDSNGDSEYEIQTSEDIRRYLNDVYRERANELGIETMKIPSNMYIWATMNSADQGVYPMDTAFKRRWDFEYISINEGENVEAVVNSEFTVADKIIKWNSLRKAINDELIKVGINEDKLLGPFFIDKNILASQDNNRFKKAFCNKVLMYLFEDAARMKRDKIFVAGKDIIFSKLCSDFIDKGIDIFVDGIKNAV